MQGGSAELTRNAAMYAVCLAFAVTFLLASALGASTWTALIRGLVVALLSRLLAPALIRPCVSAMLDAIARDRAQAAAAARAREQEASD